MKLTIVEAFFLKDDADTFGKQDPFIAFSYNNTEFKTKTQDEAGKHAVFNETFTLADIHG